MTSQVREGGLGETGPLQDSSWVKNIEILPGRYILHNHFVTSVLIFKETFGTGIGHHYFDNA